MLSGRLSLLQNSAAITNGRAVNNVFIIGFNPVKPLRKVKDTKVVIKNKPFYRLPPVYQGEKLQEWSK
jgi:hypothetical protein